MVYDIYEMLMDILYVNFLLKKRSELLNVYFWGISLFDEIFKLRFCKDVEILEYFCFCYLLDMVFLEDGEV